MNLQRSLFLLASLICLPAVGPVQAQDAAPADRNAVNPAVRPGGPAADSPVTFPKEGPIPANSGPGAYGQALKALAAEERCAYLDMTTLWAESIRSAKGPPHLFYRNVVHANEYAHP